IMSKIEDFIKSNAPGSLYGEWAKKEDCWNALKGEVLNIDLDSLSQLLINPAQLNKRIQITENEIDDKIIEAELYLIKSIPLNKWSEISRLGSNIDEITQH